MADGLVIAAPASGSGKTVVTLALLSALKARAVNVVSAKAGPDYIDPRFHERATGRPCVNLDPWAMRPALVRTLAAGGAGDLLVIEGVMGLFDGAAGGAGSTADLAAMLGLPVVLVVDVSRQAQSAAALSQGVARYRAGVGVDLPPRPARPAAPDGTARLRRDGARELQPRRGGGRHVGHDARGVAHGV